MWLDEAIERWVHTILADDDIRSPIPASDEECDFSIIAREDGIIAGAWAVDHIIARYSSDIDILWNAVDGEIVEDGECVAVLSGGRETILKLERSILNVLGQLSGIATNTASWCFESPVPLACTRKTVWGLLDKWAVHLGGGMTHRLSKGDACMLKENDLSEDGVAQTKSIEMKVAELSSADIGAFLTIEVREVGQALSAAQAWKMRQEVHKCVIMLDNMGPEGAKAVDQVLKEADLRDGVVLEGSGGIIYSDLKDWQNVGVDVLSTSRVNRGVEPLDLSMLVECA